MGIKTFNEIENGGGGSVTPTTGIGGFDTEDAVKTPSGQSELNNYLYDAKLSNVFKDYQENIANLNQGEQQNLQDAYYIREMSKKYLGEYASNVGIGDVSGNLLDIYGNYQKNKADIKTNYDALELDLNKTYRDEKTQAFGEKMQSQFDMELADFTESSQAIMFNAITGDYGDEYASEWDYIKGMRDSGEMSAEDYQKTYVGLYQTMVDRVTTNIQNDNLEGYETVGDYLDSFNELQPADRSVMEGVAKQKDEQNTMTDVINNLNTGNYGEGVEGMDYLNENRDLIGEKAFQGYYNQIYSNIYAEAFNQENFENSGLTVDEYVEQYSGENSLSSTDQVNLKEQLDSYIALVDEATIDVSIADSSSETFIGADYDFNASTVGENVGSGSYMYEDANGIRSFAVDDNSEADREVSGWYASKEDITDWFRSQNEDENPVAGKEVVYSATKTDDEGNVTNQDFTYVYSNGQWHRMVQENIITTDTMATWENNTLTENPGRDNGRMITEGENFSMDNREDMGGIFDWRRTNLTDVFTYGENSYTKDANPATGDTYAQKEEAIMGSFEKAHSDGKGGIVNHSVVFYQNHFYYYTANQVYHMTKTDKIDPNTPLRKQE